MRSLASVQVISNIQPIQGADNIVMCKVQGWQCVIAKKDNFNINDKIVYIEVDSLLPNIPIFEFMTQYKFRVKTIKLRGCISQGLVIPLSVLPANNYFVDQDVSDLLGIKKWEPAQPKQPKSKLPKILQGFKTKGKFIPFPSFCHKTDETRCQILQNLLDKYKGKDFYMTEKMDGCLSGDTLIFTDVGKLSIKQICDKKFKGNILSYNTTKEKLEFNKITNHLTQENNDDWYELETDSGEVLKITGTHLIWLQKLKCYRKVSELLAGDIVLIN